MTNDDYNKRMVSLQAQKIEMNTWFWKPDKNFHDAYISKKLLLARLVARQRKMDTIMKVL